MKSWLVEWDKVNGKYTQQHRFYVKEYAIRFLNSLILDKGKLDARLRYQTVQVGETK